MTATWTNLADAGLTFGDEFMYHGYARKAPKLVGRRVRIERRGTDSQAFNLVDAETGVKVEHATSLKRAMWWVA